MKNSHCRALSVLLLCLVVSSHALREEGPAGGSKKGAAAADASGSSGASGPSDKKLVDIPAPKGEPKGYTKKIEDLIRKEGTEWISGLTSRDDAVEFPKACIHDIPLPSVGGLSEHARFFRESWVEASEGKPDDGLDATQFATFYKKVVDALPDSPSSRELKSDEAMDLKNRALASIVYEPYLRTKVGWLEFFRHQCTGTKFNPETDGKPEQASLPDLSEGVKDEIEIDNHKMVVSTA